MTTNQMLALLLFVGLLHNSLAQLSRDQLDVTIGDGIDNDGDGLIDEEYCYNGIDEDGDGRMNEDCAFYQACPNPSSIGREFVIAFLDNQPDDSAFVPLNAFVSRASSSGGALDVILETPLLVQPGAEPIPARTSISDTVREQGKMFDLPYQLRITDSSTKGTSNKVLYMKTNNDATFVGYNMEKYTADSFVAFPADAAGTDYFAATYVPSMLNTEIAVVGLYSDTVVNVTVLPDHGYPDTPRLMIFYAGKAFHNGESFQITVNPFHTIQLTSEYDMTGTRLTSDKPFAVFAGNLRTWIRDDRTEAYIQSRDHLAEQMPPVSTYGSRFVTRNYPPHHLADLVRIIASEDDTVVTMRRSNASGEFDTSHTLRNAGMYTTVWLERKEILSITTSKPTMAVQYTHSQRSAFDPQDLFSDPSLIVVPDVDQFLSEYVFEAPNYVGTAGLDFANHVLLTAQSGQEGYITLDGSPLRGVDWIATRIPATGNSRAETYMQGLVTLSAGGVHRLSSSYPFGAIQWSVGDRESVGTSLGMRFNGQRCSKCFQVICGDKVDNDCDGRTDEERCDGYDDDGDGLVDEDCNCSGGGGRQIYTHTTTTTSNPIKTEALVTEPTTTEAPEVKTVPPPSGLCSTPVVRGDCNSLDVVFVVDLSRPQIQRIGGAVFNTITTFINAAARSWLPQSYSNYAVLAYQNGYPIINQRFTTDSNAIANAASRIGYDVIRKTNNFPIFFISTISFVYRLYPMPKHQTWPLLCKQLAPTCSDPVGVIDVKPLLCSLLVTMVNAALLIPSNRKPNNCCKNTEPIFTTSRLKLRVMKSATWPCHLTTFLAMYKLIQDKSFPPSQLVVETVSRALRFAMDGVNNCHALLVDKFPFSQPILAVSVTLAKPVVELPIH